MKSVALLLLLAGIALSQQFVPVPSHPFGITLPRSTAGKAQVDFEIFIDLLCSDSKAFLPEWEKFLDLKLSDGSLVKDKISVTYHLETLPYHHNSFFTHKLAAYLQANYDVNMQMNYVHAIYAGQEQFLDEAVKLNEHEVISKLIQYASDQIGIDADTLEKAWDGYTYEMDARYIWKYAISRRVTGTPAIVLNGVLSEDVPMTSEALQKAFLPYLQ